MLRKLLKYDFMSFGRIMPLLYICTIVLSFITRFMQSMIGSDNSVLSFISGTMVFSYVIVLIVNMIAVFFFAAQQYYKKFYSSNAYLYMSLPTKPSAHILSSLISSFVNFCVTMIVVFLSLINIGGFKNFFNDFKLLFSAVEPLNINPYTLVASVCGVAMLCGIMIILMLYFSMTIGNMSNRHRTALSVGVFLGVYMIYESVAMTFLSNILNKFMTALGAENPNSSGSFMSAVAEGDLISKLFNQAMLTAAIEAAVISIILYAVTHYITSKNYNLS